MLQKIRGAQDQFPVSVNAGGRFFEKLLIEPASLQQRVHKPDPEGDRIGN